MMSNRDKMVVGSTLIGFCFGFITAMLITCQTPLDLFGVTRMAKLGENRGDATIRIEKELNERWGKGPFLIYEIHNRHYSMLHSEKVDQQGEEYETARWTSAGGMFYKVKRIH